LGFWRDSLGSGTLSSAGGFEAGAGAAGATVAVTGFSMGWAAAAAVASTVS